jgi:S-(hydroxymethyl)glutathione dehydrogenase / alcohol dehydrogenase
MTHLPDTARAAILTQQDTALSIADIELPKELEVGQVLVQVLYSGICGSQLGEIAGVKGPDKFLPHLLGHEGCGNVLATGPGVKFVKPNDRVVLHWRKGKGIDSAPPKYRWQGKLLNAGQVTTFNDYAVVSENRLTTIPKNLDNKVTPLLGCAVTTGFGVVENNANVKIGESIAVFGAGGVGLNIIQAAAMRSAYPIIAIDKFQEKLHLAKSLGATHAINASHSDPAKAIMDLMQGSHLDVTVDNTGNPKVIEQCYGLTSDQGRTILVGVPKIGHNINIHTLPLHFGKSITGSHGGECDPSEDIPRLIKLHQAGKLELASLISNEFALDEINTAIEMMKMGDIIGRCIIKM